MDYWIIFRIPTSGRYIWVDQIKVQNYPNDRHVADYVAGTYLYDGEIGEKFVWVKKSTMDFYQHEVVSGDKHLQKVRR